MVYINLSNIKFMVSGSIVLYNSDIDKLLVTCNTFLNNSIVNKLYIIDLNKISQFKYFPINNDKIEYIELNKNIGFGAAHNYGIRNSINSGFNFHVILNPDLIIPENCINILFSIISNNPKIGLIQPKVLSNNNFIQDSCRLLPNPFNLFIRLTPFSRYFNYNYELRNFSKNTIANIPYLSGCFMFINNSIIEEIGFFDERFFLYAEDIDFSRRIHSKYQTIFYPHTTIIHYHNKSSFKKMKIFIIHLINVIKYFNKWGWLIDKERNKINSLALKNLNT